MSAESCSSKRVSPLTLILAVFVIALSCTWAFPSFVSKLRAHNPALLGDPLKVVVGSTVRLPNKDYFGNPIPRLRPLDVSVISGCNACTISEDSKFKLPIDVPSSIFITPDDSNLERFRQVQSATGKKLWLIVDTDRTVVPRVLFDFSPAHIIVGSNSEIVSARTWL